MEKFNLISWQCHVLLFVIAIVLITTILCVTKLNLTAAAKILQPFVIQIDDHTGVLRILNPVSKEKYSENVKIRDFYITKYVTARESYTPATYKYNYFTVVKALSMQSLFYSFSNFIWATSDPEKNPGIAIHINSPTQIMVKIDSIKSLPKEQLNVNGQGVQVFFKQYSPNNPYFIPRNKMVTIAYDFENKILDPELYNINPLNFRVIYYNLTDVSSGNF